MAIETEIGDRSQVTAQMMTILDMLGSESIHVIEYTFIEVLKPATDNTSKSE